MPFRRVAPERNVKIPLNIARREHALLEQSCQYRAPAANLASHAQLDSAPTDSRRVGNRLRFRLNDREFRHDSGLHPANELQAAFVKVDIASARLDVNPGLRGVVVGFLKIEIRDNLLELLLEAPCGHGTTRSRSGVGDIHPGIGSQRCLFPFLMVFFGHRVLMSGTVYRIQNRDRRLSAIGLYEHFEFSVRMFGEVFASDPH